MTLTKFLCCISLFFSSAFLSASIAIKELEEPYHPGPVNNPLGLPWLTGPLIAPAGTVIPKGHIDIEPFLYVTTTTGTYDEHWHAHSQPNFITINPVVLTYFGITEWMDFQFDPQFVYNITQGESSFHLGDLFLGFDFQVVPADKWKWVPGVKISIFESLPLGKYQNLNPKKKRTDSSGSGSFATQSQLVLYKLFHIKNKHYLSTTFSFIYNIFAPVHVKGFNTYGGGYGTRGKVYPGNEFSTILSFEYSLNEHWVLALDNIYSHENKNRFRGNPGFTTPGGGTSAGGTTSDELDLSPGIAANVGQSSSEQFSFAPAIEYNFNINWGLIAGAWISAAGKNVGEFRSGIIALNYSR